jgi:fibronectin type 3 domain-containing protein
VYRGTTEGGPYSTKLNTSALPSTAYTDASVSSSTTYYYVVTSLDSNNNESAYSNEAVATIQ